jgi:hypothetical protein
MTTSRPTHPRMTLQTFANLLGVHASQILGHSSLAHFSSAPRSLRPRLARLSRPRGHVGQEVII